MRRGWGVPAGRIRPIESNLRPEDGAPLLTVSGGRPRWNPDAPQPRRRGDGFDRPSHPGNERARLDSSAGRRTVRILIYWC
jgi:hypothetical protein